jgi:hypothetical protein
MPRPFARCSGRRATADWRQPCLTERSAFDADADRLGGVIRNAVALAALTLGGLGSIGGRDGRDPGCGGTDSPSSGPNAPCTRTKDCGATLVCREGVCTDADAGAVTALPDSGGRDATSGGDAGDGG